ncbi:MAG: DUF6488 family protein [Nitrospinota bacterium]|nr:DUF6488 family protein [Nitrospinota bacterium]
MQLRTLIFGLLLSFFSFSAFVSNAYAHGGGHMAKAPVDEATIKENAMKIVDGLVKRDKLDKSWALIAANSIEKKVISGNSVWVAIFINDKITDNDKRKLYVFLTLGGEYVAANFEGI